MGATVVPRSAKKRILSPFLFLFYFNFPAGFHSHLPRKSHMLHCILYILYILYCTLSTVLYTMVRYFIFQIIFWGTVKIQDQRYCTTVMAQRELEWARQFGSFATGWFQVGAMRYGLAEPAPTAPSTDSTVGAVPAGAVQFP